MLSHFSVTCFNKFKSIHMFEVGENKKASRDVSDI